MENPWWRKERRLHMVRAGAREVAAIPSSSLKLLQLL
jgi:hypothetical protein